MYCRGMSAERAFREMLVELAALATASFRPAHCLTNADLKELRQTVDPMVSALVARKLERDENTESPSLDLDLLYLRPAMPTLPDRDLPKAYCCNRMREDLEYVCDMHPDPSQCPDSLVSYRADRDAYGLYVHDGGPSYVAIGYCPWCGKNLPSKKAAGPKAARS